MYRHILIPTDGSELAHRAVTHGLALAKSVGAKVTALTVEASFDVYGVPASKVHEMSAAFAEHAEHAKAHAAKILSGVADAAKAAGVSCEILQVVQRTKAATSSSWRRMGGAGLRRSCSAA